MQEEIYLSWETAWQSTSFKVKLFIAAGAIAIILPSFPHFFNYIERRDGYAINDILLPYIPAIDVSIPIFALIWAIGLLTLVRAIQQPGILIVFVWSFVLVTCMRMTMIYLIPLNPPQHLIPLIDPLSNRAYGGKFLTKDLFFSGHTSIQFLSFLCLQKKSDKALALVSTILVASLVLIQHVHYTIDVLAAPFFTWLAYKGGKWWTISDV